MGASLAKCLANLIGIWFDRSKEQRNNAIFQFKSFVFLSLILILFSNIFWDITGCISSIISKEVQEWILDISKLASHLFTGMVIISVALLVVSAIIYKILYKKSKNSDRINYFHRLRIGCSFRLLNSLEDVLIFLIMGYIFDRNFVSHYTSVYSKYLWICIFIACIFEFFFSSSIGIINRFFVFWSPTDVRDKE